MTLPITLACLRCGTTYPVAHHDEDCPKCRPVARSNLTVVHEGLRVPRPRPVTKAGTGLWRWADMLPVAAEQAVSLGEGGTPLHRLERVGASLGLDNLLLKDESRNPTWSFKDRLVCLAVSSAKAMGARVIASSSSGNAGAAAAAYAAKAGIPCIVFTFQGTTGAMATQMRAYGAAVVAVADKRDRWKLLEAGVRRYGWFPTSPFFGPVVGSNPLGIEGYKTLAYEIAESMDWQVPDWCVLPVCYGDALIGMWKGFEDMMAFGWTDRMPKMVAAEIYGSIGAAVEAGTDAPPDMDKTHDTIAVSIGATQGTFQAVDIVRRSGGAAVSIGNDEMSRWQLELARSEGLYLEPASVAPLAAVERLRREGRIGSNETAVVLGTASGLKDPGRTAELLGDLPVVPPDLDGALGVIRERYGFDL